ncbi:pescadillo [Tanacetum coccineum]
MDFAPMTFGQLEINHKEIGRLYTSSKYGDLIGQEKGLFPRSTIPHGEHPLSLGKTSVWNQFFQIARKVGDAEMPRPWSRHSLKKQEKPTEEKQESIKSVSSNRKGLVLCLLWNIIATTTAWIKGQDPNLVSCSYLLHSWSSNGLCVVVPASLSRIQVEPRVAGIHLPTTHNYEKAFMSVKRHILPAAGINLLSHDKLQDQVPSSEPGALMNLVVNATFVSKNDEETRVWESLLSVITSFGGVVSWVGDGAPFEESNQDMTLIIMYVIVDRPTQSHKFISRDYILLQWVFDCINARIIPPTEDYMVLPPHLFPFVDNEAEGLAHGCNNFEYIKWPWRKGVTRDQAPSPEPHDAIASPIRACILGERDKLRIVIKYASNPDLSPLRTEIDLNPD